MEHHRNNTQGTWKILNSIIKKGQVSNNSPNYFIKNNIIINKIANEFNKLFVNVGPTLANNIPEQRECECINERAIRLNPNSMFIRNVLESEIVHQFKNKKSSDSTDMDITLVKEIIDQHMAAELWGNKHTHPSPAPFTAGNVREL